VLDTGVEDQHIEAAVPVEGVLHHRPIASTVERSAWRIRRRRGRRPSTTAPCSRSTSHTATPRPPAAPVTSAHPIGERLMPRPPARYAAARPATSPAERARKAELASAGQPGRPEQQDGEHERRQEDLAHPLANLELQTSDGDAVVLEPRQELRGRADEHGAHHGAREAAGPADHQHGNRQEGEVEVELTGSERTQELRVHCPSDTGAERAEDEGDRALPAMPMPIERAAERLRETP
jgi:hypothetical protein